MTLFVYNSLTRKKDEFVPLHPPKVGMYACGITAYDTCHLGHARAAVVFDMVYRYLKHKKYDVTYVRNYTDVDDKIIARANKEGVSCAEITDRYIAEYERDMGALGVLMPDIAPRATAHIDDMIATIAKLIEKDHAYAVDGNVYFSVRSFPGYGKLSGKNIEELTSGARVDVDEKKRDPLDFALWKPAKPGEPTWPSPWGEGRPGWHIECSAMSTKYLGQPFDIHGGGRDLVFPHHENEIAQAEGACGCTFATYWLHNGFINIDAEKMSKSLGNITAIGEVLKKYDSEALRLFLLSNHYRSPIDYTQQSMAEAESSLDRFYETAKRLHRIHPGKNANDEAEGAVAIAVKELLVSFEERFVEAMDDDFNTARSVGLVFEAVRAINRYLDEVGECVTPFSGWVVLQFMHLQHVAGEVLGIFGSDEADYHRRCSARVHAERGVDAAQIEALIAERRQARSQKDFARADAIRDELGRLGVEFKDKPDGTTEWKLR